MDLINGLDGVEVVNTRVETNLVHDDDASLLGSSIKLTHRRADIAGGDNVGLALDGGFDDIGVVGVGDERDDKVVLGDGLLQRSGVSDVERDRSRVAEVRDELLRGFKSAAGYQA